MENEVQNEKSLAFWMTMLVVLFVAVFGIFVMLRMVLPQELAAQNQPPAVVDTVVEEEQLPVPKYCTFCGDALPENFEWGRFCPYCGKNIDN